MDGDAAVLEWLLEPGPHRDGSAQEWPDCEDLVVLEQLRARDGRVGAGDTYPDVLDRVGVGLEDLAARAPGVAVGFLELAGYQSVDLGADGSARGHYLRALQITSGAGDRRYGGYLVGVSLAHLALHADDPVRAERYARAALRGTRACSTPGMRAAFHAVVARARARLGDGAGCTVALTMSESALAQRVCADEPSWMRYFGDADLADERAHCFWDLGGDVAAQREAAGAIAGMAPTRVRRLAIDTALQASALARAGDVDAACATGRVAVGVASRTASYRGVEGVARMLAHLQPYADAAVVRDLVDHAGEVLRAPGGSGGHGP